MMRSLPQLTIVALFVAIAASTASAQPGAGPPSVLAPGHGPQQPLYGPGQSYGDPGAAPYAPEQFGDTSGGGGCETCDGWALGARRPRLCGTWGAFDVLLWWNKGRYFPALVTSSEPVDRGVLGRPSTTVEFGEEHIGSDLQAGGRITAGAWLNPDRTTGVGMRFFALEGDRTGFEAVSDGTTALARPFFNVALPGEDALLIGLPGLNSGRVDIDTENDFLTTEVFGRFYLHGDYLSRIDLLAGYHFARIDDSLQIDSQTSVLDPLSPIVGSRFDVSDRFSTENEFHGALIGLMGERTHGRARYSWLGKLGVGNMRQEVTIAGNTTLNLNGGGSLPIDGGLLAQGTNIGTSTRNRLAFVPEANFNLHYQLTPGVDLTVGYSIIYFTSVAFSGDQIDRQINLTQQGGPIVGPARPTDTFNVTDFWVQGLNLGIAWNF